MNMLMDAILPWAELCLFVLQTVCIAFTLLFCCKVVHLICKSFHHDGHLLRLK